jgi:hypothetical protein
MGLLNVHPGTAAITPIVRVGNIALFSDEPIRMDTGDEPGVLIEVRSFGGLSGSPAFVNLPVWRRGDWGAAIRGDGKERQATRAQTSSLAS